MRSLSVRRASLILSFMTSIIHASSAFSIVSPFFQPSRHGTTKTIQVYKASPENWYEIKWHLASSSIEDLEYNYDDSEAESKFGTKEYWDDMYIGMGDFDSEEYSWYYDFDTIKPLFTEYLPLPNKQDKEAKHAKVLVPGVGNDSVLLDMYNFGYYDITAFDYSLNAIERQQDLLSYDSRALEDITLLVRDARDLDDDWTDEFDIIFEKGGLDAIYLSGAGNVERAAEELKRVVKKDGYMMSISGVVPEELRRQVFSVEDWEWVRDGSDDLKAGCFVWRRI